MERSRSKTPKRQKRGRSRSKSKTRSRRVSFAPTTNAIARADVGLGQSARTVLKTEFFANVVTAASGIFTGYLKPGSGFDPTGDIAAIQPALWDQWAAVYNRYVVEKATVKIEFGYASNTGGAFVAAAYPSVSSGALTQYQGAASQPFSKSLLFTGADNTSSNTMTFKLDHAKVLGRKGMVTAEDNGALISADPTTGQYMVLPIFIQYNQASSVSAIIRVVMYQTVFFDRRLNVVDA